MQLPPDHYIVQLNQGVRETVLPSEQGLPQPERGLFAAKVPSAATGTRDNARRRLRQGSAHASHHLEVKPKMEA